MLLVMRAAVVVSQFDEQVLQRAAYRMYRDTLASGKPYLLDGPALAQRGHGNLDETILLCALEHQRINASGGDHETLLGFQELRQRPHARYASLDYDGQPVADLLDLGEQVRTQEDGFSGLAGAKQNLAHLEAANRIEGGGRLVEDPQARIIYSGLGHRAPFL